MNTPAPDDLSVLDPPRVQIPLASGGTLVLTPLRVRSLAAFVRALGPKSPDAPRPWLRDKLADPDCDLWQLIADDGEALTAALAVAADVPLEVIEGMEPGEFMTALDAMLRVNSGFFLSWLLAPILRAAQIKTAPAEDGPT
jgi:hypothetical protein